MAIEAMIHIHPNAYHRGYRDFRKGNLDMPYRKDTLWEKEWIRGFNAAYFMNLKYITDSRYKGINHTSTKRINP